MTDLTGTRRSGEPRAELNWLAILSGVLVFLVIFLLGRTIARQEEENLRRKIKAECDHLATLIEMDVRSRIPDLQRTMRRWDALGIMEHDDFVREMEAFESDVPGFQALEWSDGDGIIRWVVPLSGNERAVNLNLTVEANRSSTLRKAGETQKPAMSEPIALVQGGNGLVVIFPIHIRAKPAGYLLAVFRIKEWMEYVFSIEKITPSDDDFRIGIHMDGQPLFIQSGWNELKKNDTDISSTLWILDHSFSVSIRPEQTFINRYKTQLPLLLTIFGALFSILVVCIILLYQKSYAEAWHLQVSQKALESEIGERKKVEEQLQRAFSRIDWATKAAHMGVWTWDLSNDKLTWDARIFELFGIPDDIVPDYDTWRNAVHPDDREQTERTLHDAVLGKCAFNTGFRIIRPDGTLRYLRAAARVERDAYGKPLFLNGLNWDVTEAREIEDALKKSEAQVRQLLNSTGEAIYGIDLDGNCTFANTACARVLGYSGADELLGKNMHRLIHHSWSDGRPMAMEDCNIFRAFRDGKPSHVDDEVLWKFDGTSFPAEYWSYPQIVNGEITGAVVTFVDITERRKTEETIRHMATHDGLTNLPSLLLCRDRLGMAISQANRDGKKAAVLFIDLDGFKNVNDTYGHDAGDTVLKETAKRLCSSVRGTDTVARIGGDEFLAVITELQNRDNAESIAKKMIASLAERFVIGNTSVHVSASIGIALFPREKADNVESLIKLADQAMYRVKKSGKNGIRFAGDESDT